MNWIGNAPQKKKNGNKLKTKEIEFICVCGITIEESLVLVTATTAEKKNFIFFFTKKNVIVLFFYVLVSTLSLLHSFNSFGCFGPNRIIIFISNDNRFIKVCVCLCDRNEYISGKKGRKIAFAISAFCIWEMCHSLWYLTFSRSRYLLFVFDSRDPFMDVDVCVCVRVSVVIDLIEFIAFLMPHISLHSIIYIPMNFPPIDFEISSME